MGPELVLTIKTPVAPSLVAVCPSGGGALLAIGKETGHVRRQGTFPWHVLQGSTAHAMASLEEHQWETKLSLKNFQM